MRRWGVLLGCCLCGGATACPPPWPERPWSEVQQIVAARPAPDLSGFVSRAEQYVFTHDGRFARLQGEAAGPRAATFGRYRRHGAWVEVQIEGMAVDPATLLPEQLEHLARRLDEAVAVDAAAPIGSTRPGGLERDDDLDLDDVPAYDPRRARFLRLPYRGGEVLLHQGALAHAANGWNGAGALRVSAAAWRLTGTPQGDEPLEVALIRRTRPACRMS
jgi:hypothetical protein